MSTNLKKIKVITVEFLDYGEWDIPASVVADHYAKGVDDLEVISYKDRFNYAMENDWILLDWVHNRMEWADVMDVSKQKRLPRRTSMAVQWDYSTFNINLRTVYTNEDES